MQHIQSHYYPMPPANDHGQGFNDFFCTLRRRKKMLALFTGLFLLGGLGFVTLTPKMYEAHTTVLMQRPDAAPIPQDVLLLSTVEMLQSPDIIEQAVADLKTTPQRIVNGLSVTPVGRSQVIDISYRDTDAVFSAKVVNQIVDTYQTKQLTDKAEEAARYIIGLERRLSELSDKAKKSAQAVEEYRIKENLLDDDTLNQQMNTVRAQIIQATAEETSAKTQLMAEQAQLQNKYGTNHPRLKAVRAQLYAMSSTRKAINLQEKLTALEVKKTQNAGASIGLKTLEQEAQSDRVLYETFLMKSKETALAQTTRQPDLKVIAKARIPHAPANVSGVGILMILTLIGFIFGVIAALILEQLEHDAVRTIAHTNTTLKTDDMRSKKAA